jgi:phage-related minor tail protein
LVRNETTELHHRLSRSWISAAAWDWFSTTIPAALNTLKMAWESNFMGIRSLFEGAMTHIKLVFALFRAAFEGDWHKFGEILRQIVENIKNTLVNIFKGIWETIKNIDWIGLGKAIIQGIGNGIIALGGWLIDTLVNAATAAYEAAKGFLGIESPSKLFFSMGKAIPQGLAEGINSAKSLAANAANSMAASLVPATVSSLPSLPAGGGGHGAVINITYAPAMSTASPAEFEANFVPLVDAALRRVNRRR